ncbi:type II toxin-antitoxin system HicA family toxin [Vibrio parahaemolyticus]
MIKLLEKSGWELFKVKVSQHKFKHPDFEYPIVVPHHCTNNCI